MRTRPRTASLRARLLGLALLAAAPASAAPVVVSSKIDTEGGVLGHMILLALDAAGIETRDRVQLGTTPVMRAALLGGEIDVYPEYTGNAATFFNRAADPLWKDAAKAYAEAKRLDYEANRIVWLTPSPANNTWAVALRKDVAEPNGIRTFSEFGRWVSGGGTVRLAASSEFVHSPSALPAFQASYGFKLTSDQIIALAGGDTAATLAAAAKKISGVNAAMVYGTDGGIPFSGLTVLEDDKAVQPIYQPAPIVREAVLRAEPRIAEILKPIFEGLDLETVQKLNGRVQVGGEPARAVAESYLRDKGVLKKSDAFGAGALKKAGLGRGAACFETPARSGLLSMRTVGGCQSKNGPHAEEPSAGRRLEARRSPMPAISASQTVSGGATP